MQPQKIKKEYKYKENQLRLLINHVKILLIRLISLLLFSDVIFRHVIFFSLL